MGYRFTPNIIEALSLMLGHFNYCKHMPCVSTYFFPLSQLILVMHNVEKSLGSDALLKLEYCERYIVDFNFYTLIDSVAM